MNELNLQSLRRQAESWHKVLRVIREPGCVILRVVRGVSGSSQDPIITEDFKFAPSPELEAFLIGPEFQRKLFSPSKRGIVLVDVAGYSRFDTQGQSAILTMFYESLQLAELSNDLFSREASIDQIVPTGDGGFIVFKPELNDHVFRSVFSIHASFCTHQMRLSKRAGTGSGCEVLGIRLACHLGDVDFIVDAAGNRNAYGTGLNETARILHHGRGALKERLNGEDPVSVVFYGPELLNQATQLTKYFQGLPGVRSDLIDLGTVTAKHNVTMELQCVTDLPKHILVPFNAQIPAAPSSAGPKIR